MAPTATPSTGAADGIEDNDFGAEVSTSCRDESVEGVSVHPRDLEAGDDVYVEYRERTGGGLRYRTYAQCFTARVTDAGDDGLALRVDFSGGEARIRFDADELGNSGYPTVELGGDEYAVKRAVRRTDVDEAREVNETLVRRLRADGVDAEYKEGGHPVKVRPDTPEEYQRVVAAMNRTDADVRFLWYETEDDLRGEEAIKSREAVETHDEVLCQLDAA